MTIKRVKVWAWACRCERCAYVWTALGVEAPTRCPGCKARGFDKPARPYGRRAAKRPAGRAR